MREEIIFVGKGGQGIVLMGSLFAKACMREKKEVAFASSYGGEVRGGECSSQIIVSSGKIDFPGVTGPDILVVFSLRGYQEWIGRVSRQGTVLIDEDLIRECPESANHIFVSATRIAAKQGIIQAANMVMLGALARLSGLVRYETLIEVLKEELNQKSLEINLKALAEGYNLDFKKGQ